MSLDTRLQDKLKAATNADAVVEIAKASGFVISADDVKKAQAEVSDEELENAAGGGCTGIVCIEDMDVKDRRGYGNRR